ncbi:multiple monosaccharide ABC transporter permease [Gracilibacillus alcaliphilus]|uniref:multiple monosaccharide ABC transporter permease n=1 Tax=Gracilibacillus alcaliphilus TaxID=1401441 RepID=UPI001957C37D|nr:multiple monosaccharide ABC transporter permease [Gracilibacillus alcaliphilus]MBM7675662.1 putative multiple sugar transport system permease protein [Gracilibacillus alcaliphilus]
MQVLIQLFRNNIREYGMIIALILITGLFFLLTDGVNLKPLNLTNLILQNGFILVLAIGMVLVIITGNIDLSVGSVVAFIGAIAGVLIINMNVPVWLAVIIAIAAGGLIGIWQGFWIAYVGIPSFIVTLAGMLIFRGLTLWLLDGKSLAPFPESFQKLSSGFVPDLFQGGELHIFTIVLSLVLSFVLIYLEFNKRKTQVQYQFEVVPLWVSIAKLALLLLAINWFAYQLAMNKGIPTVLVIVLVLIIVYSFIMKKTVMGRHIYATGGNKKAADLSGIKTKRVVFWVFVNNGVLAALAGLMFAARLNSATPAAGNMLELDAIASVFIGGASMAGGVGTVIGAIVGGLVMGVMNNGMSLIGVGIDWQQAIKGMVLLIAVGFDVYNKNKR